MGSEQSSTKRICAFPLKPQPYFPKVVSHRFINPLQTVSLRIPARSWSSTDSTIDIVNVNTGNTTFKIQTNATTGKRQLANATGLPIAVMDGYIVGNGLAVYVPTTAFAPSTLSAPSANALDRHLCYIQTDFLPLEQPLVVELEHPRTKETMKLCVAGSWSLPCMITLKPSPQAPVEYIGRIYHELNAEGKPVSQSEYILDVAPGVDAALLVLICAALDEEAAKVNTNKIERNTAASPVAMDEMTLKMREVHHEFTRHTTRKATMGNAKTVVWQMGGDPSAFNPTPNVF